MRPSFFAEYIQLDVVLWLRYRYTVVVPLPGLLFTPSIYSRITRLAKLYDPLQVICVLLNCSGQWEGATESIEPAEKFHGRVVFCNKILHVEKVNIALEIYKQIKERLISTKAFI